jgi:3-oxoacyl-(acyl-carrier-protein) synthase
VTATDVLVSHAASGSADSDLASWAAGELGALGWNVDGLYVATSNAGRAESVEFWRAAGETGLAFANPRLFPWTLANSPTGAIAKALDVRGPTYTLVGGVEAVTGAIEHAADDLADGIVTSAAVVAVDVVEGTPRVVAVKLDSVDAAHQLIATLPTADAPTSRPATLLHWSVSR